MRYHDRQAPARPGRPSIRALFLGCCLLACLSVPGPVRAFVFTVDTTQDSVDATPGDGVCGDGTVNSCSLRAAIQEANAWPGDDTVLLGGGTYVLDLAPVSPDTVATGDLDVEDGLTVAGQGESLTTIDASALGDRAFDIAANVQVTIQGLTITKGNAANGGGVRNGGRLTMRDVTLDGNTANATFNGGGGGLYQTGLGATLDLERATLSANSATASSGGGLSLNQGTARIRFSRIVNNQAFSNGGGISINGGVTVEIEDSLIDGNQTLDANTGLGGGISSFGALTLTRSTLSNNRTQFFGGGLYTNGPTTTPTTPSALQIVNTTIHGNQSLQPTGSGGGIYIALQKHRDGTDAAILKHVTMTGNTVGVAATLKDDNLAVDAQTSGPNQGFVTIADSIVVAGAPGVASCSGPVSHMTSQGHNIFDDPNACPASGPMDNSGQVAGTVLASTTPGSAIGGPTPGFVPTGSAVGGADPARCPTTDQRGFPGQNAANCDVGAVTGLVGVANAANLAVVSIEAVPALALAGTPMAHRVTIANYGPTPTNGPVRLDYRITETPATGSPTSNLAQQVTPGTLAAGATHVFSIPTTPSLAGTIALDVLSLVDAGATPTTDPVPANDTASLSTAVYENGTVAVGIETRDAQNALATSFVAGTPFVYRIRVESTAGLARQVTLVDELPAGVVPTAVTTDHGSCSLGGQRLSCQLGDVSTTTAVTIDLQVTGRQRGNYTNTARINFLGSPAAGSILSVARDVTITTETDLSVRATAGNTQAVVGGDLIYLVTARNDGPSSATNPRLTIDLPPQLTLRTIQSEAGWTCDQSALPRIVCSRPSLPAETDSSLTLFTTPQSAGTITLAPGAVSIATDGTDIDPVASNDTLSSALVTSVLVPQQPVRGADLELALLDALPVPGRIGAKLSYTITARNLGPDTAGQVVLTVDLPALVDFDSASAGCTANGRSVSCQLGQIASQTSASASVVVVPRQAGTAHLAVAVSDPTGRDPVPTNNTAALDTPIQTVATAQGTGTTAGAGLSKGSGACFIATAAYGSYLDPHVAALRRFRDRFLLPYPAGRALVAFYYRHSPTPANFISRHDGLRLLTRWLLTPLVLAVEYPAPAAGLALSLLLVALRRRRHGRTTARA